MNTHNYCICYTFHSNMVLLEKAYDTDPHFQRKCFRNVTLVNIRGLVVIGLWQTFTTFIQAGND